MQLIPVLKELSLEAYQDVFEPAWDKSEPLLSSMEFLSEDYIVRNSRLAGIDNENIQYIVGTAKKINASPCLRRLFVHGHYLLFRRENSPGDIGMDFPDMRSVLPDEGYTYNLLLALSAMDVSKKYFQSKGMPEDVMLGAFKDISIWVSHYKQNFSHIGLSPQILNWERNLLLGDLFRLGRLQFHIRPFGGRITVFRNKATQQIQAFVNNGIKINSAGSYDGVDGQYDENAWESALTEDHQQVTGNPLTPRGTVMKKTVSLNLAEWDKVLEMYDPVLDIHIPAGERMDMQSCSDAIDYSIKFFTQYFPEKTYKGWACNTWLFDNQYETILADSANIVKFQREFHLYPLGASGDEALRRIFGENVLEKGIDQAPRESSMQKAVAEFIEQGGRLRQAGGFFLKEDLPWGSQHYRNAEFIKRQN